jgi:NDP-sugar pyrophosphorylase family protein
MKPTLMILAAGMGSRYGGLKQIDHIGPSGEAIIDYSIYDAIRAGFGKVVFIIRRNIEKDIRKVFDDKLKGRIEVAYAYQELDMVPPGLTYSPDRIKPWGTAHAIWTARELINEPFVVINADDFYGPSAYTVTASFLNNLPDRDKNRYCMVGYRIGETLSDFGSVSRGMCEGDANSNLRAVVEIKEIERKDGKIAYRDSEGATVGLRGDELVSMNIWGFNPSVFPFIETAFSAFMKENGNDIKSELYIPTVINRLIAEKAASVSIIPASETWFGVTYREDKPMAESRIGELIDHGIYPVSLWNRQQ